MTVPVVSLEPVGHDLDGSPRFAFSCGFPSKGVKATRSVWRTPEEAQAAAAQALDAYARDTWPCGMGAVIGATAVDGGFKGVYVTYYSRS